MNEADAPLVYLHGMPGGPGELELVRCDPARAYVPDRRAAHLATPEGLADDLARHFGDRKIILAGFSLGAFAALRLAAHAPQQIAHLHLIAPAGPLETGDYLPHMAGGPVFRMARDRPALLGPVTRVQSLLARWAPDFLARQVFATAQGGDAPLAADPGFRTRWSAMARACLSQGAPGYLQEVRAYVPPWAALLSRIDAPVTIWSGSADNWAPPAMADDLATRLPKLVAHHRLDGLSHYSTLADALARIA